MGLGEKLETLCRTQDPGSELRDAPCEHCTRDRPHLHPHRRALRQEVELTVSR